MLTLNEKLERKVEKLGGDTRSSQIYGGGNDYASNSRLDDHNGSDDEKDQAQNYNDMSHSNNQAELM